MEIDPTQPADAAPGVGGDDPPWRDRLRRGLAVATAITLVSAIVAAIVGATRPGEPDRDLAAIVAFVGEATTVHIDGTEEWAMGGPRDGLGSTFSSKARITGDVRLPRDGRWLHDEGEFVSEFMTVGEMTYSRESENAEGLANELWVAQRVPEAETGGGPTTLEFAPVGEDAAEAASLLWQGSSFGAMPLDLRQMLGHLEHPERLSPGVLRVRLPLPAFFRAVAAGSGFDPEMPAEMEGLDGEATIDLTSGRNGRLDRMVMAVRQEVAPENGMPGEVSTSTTDLRFSRWGEPVELAAPPPDRIDATPMVDEEGLAGAPFPVLAPAVVPPPLKLVDASFYDGAEADDECPSVSLSYVDPAAEIAAADEDEYVSPPYVDFELTATACTADDEHADAAADLPRGTKAEPFVAGPHRGTIYRFEDPEFGGRGFHVELDVGQTRMAVSGSIPEAQVMAMVASLGAFDASKQPLATMEELLGPTAPPG